MIPSRPQPAFEPRSTIIRPSIAVSVPSARPPIRTCMTCAEAGFVAWKSSARVSATRTGRRERERRTRGERLDDRELAAEGAAERLRDDADPLERQPEGAGELALRHERALRARRDDERPVRLEPGRRDLGLDVRLVDPRRPEGGRDDGVARVEARRRCRPVRGTVSRTFPESCSSSSSSCPRSTPAWIDSRSPPVSSSSATRASGAPGSIACSRSTTTSSGSYSTTTASAPSSAAASLSATTIATGWPANTTSSRASGSAVRSVPGRRDREVGGGQDGDDALDRERGVLVARP